MSLEVISPKVSISRAPGVLRILVRGKVERWKEALLGAWLLAWCICGAVVIYFYGYAKVREERMVLLLFLVFWAYYLWRVGRTWLYRLGGNELISIQGEELRLKRSFFTYGKSRSYYLDSIRDFRAIKLSPRSLAYTFENTWWVLGGERLGFDYQGRFVKFAMQLDEGETSRVAQAIAGALKRLRKRTKKRNISTID